MRIRHAVYTNLWQTLGSVMKDGKYNEDELEDVEYTDTNQLFVDRRPGLHRH